MLAFDQNLEEDFFKNGTEEKTCLYCIQKQIENDPDYIFPYMKLAAYWMGEKKYKKNVISTVMWEKNSKYFLGLSTIIKWFDIILYFIEAGKYYGKVLNLNPANPQAANNLDYLLSENPDAIDETFKLSITGKK